MGCISAYEISNVHIWKCTMNAERYIQVLEQHMLPSRYHLFQGRSWIFHQENVTAFFGEDSGCSPSRKLCCFQQLKIFGTSYRAARIWYLTRTGSIFSSRSRSWFPWFPDVYRLLLKEERMLHSNKHGPGPSFRWVAN